MSEPILEFDYAAPVLRTDKGMIPHYIPIPDDIADIYQGLGIRRLLATMNDHTVRRAIQGKRDEERMLVLGRPVLKDIGVKYGDTVTVHLQPDPDPDHVELSEEMIEVLNQDAEAADRFYSFTPGKQRSLALYVNEARRPETRIKRALELAEKIRTNTLYGDN